MAASLSKGTMNTGFVVALALCIGLINGLRSFTAPAVVAWAAHLRWIDLRHSYLGFLGSTAAAYVLAALALVELVIDKLPGTPNRTAAPGLVARIALGALSGAALCIAGGQSAALGAVLGGLGGVMGAFAGYKARTGLVRTLKTPDYVIAVLEDLVAVGGGLLIVSRF
jgi:uncharacterized membrane protein